NALRFAIVGGCSEALFIQRCWEFISGEKALLQCRSDSSAAHAPAARIRFGRSRRIAAGMLWLQEMTAEKAIRATGVPTAVNTSDAGTKCLSKARLKKYLMKMIHEDDEKIMASAIQAPEEVRKLGKAFETDEEEEIVQDEPYAEQEERRLKRQIRQLNEELREKDGKTPKHSPEIEKLKRE
ncbi:unnamed protein product, partial [Durusdinium trenchii]